MNRSRRILLYIAVLAGLMAATPLLAFAADGEPAAYGTALAVVPPLIAITLALITKEVYSSLFVGILAGGILYGGTDLALVLEHIVIDGFTDSLADAEDAGILLFLVILGALVSLMSRSGGARAFGRWAAGRIKGRKGAQFATIFLGLLIFVDDYFNCLTVGSVMRPVTDSHRISREKLAYLIDSTAEPVCVIAPISSFAAFAASFIAGGDGFRYFVAAIPYNFYALFTILLLFGVVGMNADFGKMAVAEQRALERETQAEAAEKVKEDGHALDLVLPIVVLIAGCLIGMLATGGYFSGAGMIAAFGDCDATQALCYGSGVALLITIVLYLARRRLSLRECMECLPEGFNAMVPAIIILTMAWTLNAMTDSLGLSDFVAGLAGNVGPGLIAFLPAIIFITACFLSFATGSSWSTFGILIGICLGLTKGDATMTIICMAACLSGSVCGDHCSPISDTTIMSSAGAACDHVAHVETQLPYAILTAAISAVSFLLAGIMKSPFVPLLAGVALLFAFLAYQKRATRALPGSR